MARIIALGIGAVLQLVVHAAACSAQERPARLVASVDLMIGHASTEDRDPYIFGDVRGLAMDTSGNIYVADSPAHEVRVFDSSGAYRYTIGRRGRGPGDLLQPCCMGMDSHGRLWIQETGNRRFSVFAIFPDSANFLWTIRMPAGPAREGSRWTFFHGNLQYISQTSLETMGAKRTARVVLDSLGRTVNELVLHEPPPDSLAEFVYRDVTPDGIATAANYVQPYGPTLLRTLGDGGEFVEAVSSRYVVIWRDSTGARITGVARPGARGAPLSERQRKYANEVVSSVKRRTRGAFPFGVPDRHPPLAGIGFDLNGHLWIQHSTPPDAPHEADVFDRRGRWLSVVQWPANVQLRGLVVNGKAALGVAADADGAQSVVRLRISGG